MNNRLIEGPSVRTPLSPDFDPWDPIVSLRKHGRHVLTSVEMTVTHLCNMRCEHCAVGDMLVMKEAPMLPLDIMLKRLDEVEHLETISLTGGEPAFSGKTVDDVLLPLLRYAHERGIRTQINSNLTLDISRYEKMLPYLDVMHISFNYLNGDDFYEVGFANSARPVPREAAYRMYETMISNAQELSKAGMMISAESMINYRTHQKLDQIHRQIAEMGCVRHEVHPMYASNFAASLPVLSLDDMKSAIHRLLDARDHNIWMLFGTLPFFSCSQDESDWKLIRRLAAEDNVTVRNDPDGRNRVNVNLFTGDVYVTDFSDIPAFGNMKQDRLDDIFIAWSTGHPLNQSVNCHCDAVSCCGPNLLVADMYYKGVDFKSRKAVTL
ncbi:radical SAM/CxCxxxxC motif protein YfkAB [Paenibacillus sp. F411]|uniref:radical SAM/CxCxxxxC motif protein YfkAB n=1 Tax=Paenibacillus sp. F411 TaxID=2820239 RepID=UPI001AAFC90F|nr:radical SAM/CxCxxxxC motif protein YfkAB [Paenibacillus sp. F411]MBO2942463.1 radical SAM/CxCxxxxC motif protein YfkAB [Paenibacillus sp. F411]